MKMRENLTTPISPSEPHPVLIIPNDEGCLLVIGQRQVQLNMSKKQMFEKAMDFLRYAAPD